MSSKETEQRAEGEGLPSTNKYLLPSLTFVSPIGKVRQREPGPVTSTPRVCSTIKPGHICRSASLNKLSDIHEDSGSPPDKKEPYAKLFPLNNFSSGNEKSDLHDPRLDEKTDRSRSILSTIASPLEVEKKYRRQAAVTTNFHEKRKIAWGCTDLTTCVMETTALKDHLADGKISGSAVEVNSTNNGSDMDSIKIISADSTGELFKKDNEESFSANDNSKAREVHEIVASNMPNSTKTNISSEAGIINDLSCSSLLNEKENISMSKDLLNEVEDVTTPNDFTEDSICISSVNSLTEISQKECIQITENKVAAVQASSSDDDIQIIDCVPLSHPFTTKPMQKIPEAFSKMELEAQLADLESLKRRADLSKLPDSGQRLLEKIKMLQEELNNQNAFQSDKSITSNEPPEKKEANIFHKKKGPPIISPQAIVEGRRLFGGKMTDERICLANVVTGQVIAQMHSSLTNAPENMKTNTPACLLTELMPHQKEGLTWLLWREGQPSPGGILADDMGLGKTLSMISLIVHVKEKSKLNAETVKGFKTNVTKDSCLIPSRATLVVAPASLIFQWEAEFQKHVRSDFLSRYVFHGPKHKRCINAKRLARYDVVLTTYGVVSSELAENFNLAGVDEKSDNDDGNSDDENCRKGKTKRKISNKLDSVLTKIAWERVILDEAHQIKNKTALISKACCKIPAAKRWCLTGTPIHNNLWDLYSLIRFLRVTPFDEEAVWKEYILSAHSSSQRLNTLVKGLLLRREKNQLCPETNKPIIGLTSKMYEEVTIKLENIEKEVYDYMFQFSRQQVKELIKTREEKEQELYGIGRNQRRNDNNKASRNPFLGGSRTIRNRDNFQTMTCVLTLLMRLRQACVHFALITQAVDMEALETIGIEKDENAELLSKCFSNMSLLDENALLVDHENKSLKQLFEKTFVSTKIKKLLEHMDRALSCGDKCVIVSQWTSLLNILEHHLEQKHILYTSITGKVSITDRQNRANSFNEIGTGPRVMLLSLTAGGVGLNLIGGNHLFLVDLHWNPALEQQASDRIYRIGQTKNVFIHKLVCLETIEQRVLALQQMKQTLAKDVLEGVASKKLSRLTVADLKYLFDLGRSRQDVEIGGTT